MKKRLIISSVIFLAFLLSSCQFSDSAPSNSVFPEPATTSLSPEPSLTATQKPTETKTLTPSSTITPTATPTLTPTPIAMPNVRVAYNTLEGIWIVDPPDPPLLLSAEIMDRVLLSDDGKKVVSLSGDGPNEYQIRVVNSDGSGERSLLSPEQLEALEKSIGEGTTVIPVDSPKWIPGTRRFLFSTRNISAAASENLYNYDLFIVDTDTGGISRIFARNAGGMAVTSLDGKKMVVQKCTSLSLAAINGKILFEDILPSVNPPLDWCMYPEIVWTADSSRFGVIVFEYTGRDPLREVNNYLIDVWSVDASSGDTSPLISLNHIQTIAISPTLDWIGYTYTGADISKDETRISTIDGSASILLATGPGRFLSFAPDGSHFAYFTGCTFSPKDKCPSDSPSLGVVVNSITGATSFFTGAYSVVWINNSQFVYKLAGSLYLGDIGGNSIEIAKADYIHSFAAKDVDFQAGRIA
jgi:hypothetical protein